MKPLIGISCGIACSENNLAAPFVPAETHSLGDAYIAAVENAGGIPVILPNYHTPELMEELVGRLDGVLLSGGYDIDPAFFGQRVKSTNTPVSVRRDAAEFALIRYVMKHTEMPILGICRGCQIINVAEGGDLITDLKTDGKEEHRLSMFPRNYPSHEVKIEAGSRLYEIFGQENIRTNSFHHQAIKNAAPGWKVVATAVSDGVIEAAEKIGDRFAMCIQWHPECMYDTDAQQGILRALVRAAEAYSRKSAENR